MRTMMMVRAEAQELNAVDTGLSFPPLFSLSLGGRSQRWMREWRLATNLRPGAPRLRL
jgi:hypothetical protein